MDIKTLIFIISTACICAGFYYTTQARLDEAEREISFLWSSVGDLQKESKRLNRQIRSLKKEKGQSK
jgi:tetrahydromethanopterin S-methyltransferase subunit G